MVDAVSRTTLRVSKHVRDTFAAVAASRSTTMVALLDEAARRLEREEAMRQATASYDRLAREDPAGFADYVTDGRRWADGLPPAAVEFPEYNF